MLSQITRDRCRSTRPPSAPAGKLRSVYVLEKDRDYKATWGFYRSRDGQGIIFPCNFFLSFPYAFLSQKKNREIDRYRERRGDDYQCYWDETKLFKKCICRHCAVCGAALRSNCFGDCTLCSANMHLDCARKLNLLCCNIAITLFKFGRLRRKSTNIRVALF